MTDNQTIVVINEHGEVIGKTYPKRAKGLIKKGRAELLSDTVLRLKDFCPTEKSEEIIMDNNVTINNIQEQEPIADTAADKLWEAFKGKHEYILFDPRKWYPNPDTANMNRCERYMYQYPDGKMGEIFSLGDWNGHWSEIRSRFIPVDPETSYTFVFWLNGGENDRYNEVCRMIAVYTDAEQQKIPDEDWSQNYIYKLNRGGVKPLKTVDGWYLFAIDLPKPDKKLLELRFVAQSAPMALRAAEEPSAYDDLEDRPDEFEGQRPQRHNIVFADGFPADDGKCWYATGYLKRKAEEEKQKAAEFERLKNEWKELVVKNIERAKAEGYTGGELKINGITIANIGGLDGINVDELAHNLAEKFPEQVVDRTPESKQSAGYAEQIDGIANTLHRFLGWLKDYNGVNLNDVHSQLKELSGMLRSGFAFGKEAKIEQLMSNLSNQFKRLRGCTSMSNGVTVSNIAGRFSLLYSELKGNFRRVTEPSGDFESALKAAMEAADVVSQITDNLDLSDLADNLDISDIAGNIDVSEIADNIDTDEIADMVIDNIDMDEIAEQVADNIDMDEIAEHVKDNLDIDEIAEQVAENIDLDDLAEKIAEKLDIKGLLREILDD